MGKQAVVGSIRHGYDDYGRRRDTVSLESTSQSRARHVRHIELRDDQVRQELFGESYALPAVDRYPNNLDVWMSLKTRDDFVLKHPTVSYNQSTHEHYLHSMEVTTPPWTERASYTHEQFFGLLC